jgi:hypothetical protein
LDSKVDNARSSAKVIEGATKTYKTEVEATVRAIIEHGKTIQLHHIVLSYLDKSAVV